MGTGRPHVSTPIVTLLVVLLLLLALLIINSASNTSPTRPYGRAAAVALTVRGGGA